MISAILFLLAAPTALIARILWDCKEANGSLKGIPSGLFAERIRVMFNVPVDVVMTDPQLYREMLPYIGTWEEG